MDKKFRFPLILAAIVFSFSMIMLWVVHINDINRAFAITGAVYALICFVFLLFQIYAFVHAHIHYDENLENIKYIVFEAEKNEWEK